MILIIKQISNYNKYKVNNYNMNKYKQDNN